MNSTLNDSILPNMWDVSKEPFAPIDDVFQKWSDIVVPIYVEHMRARNAMNGLGSSFIVQSAGRYFLVTALHVAEDARRFSFHFANMNGAGIDIGGLSFVVSEPHDLAIAELTHDWLNAHEIKCLKAVPIAEKDKTWIKPNLFLLLGYPGSKNKLSIAFGKLDRHILSITAELKEANFAKTKVVDATQFDYDHKTTINSQLINLGGKPALQGMSGGPALQIVYKKSMGTIHLSVQLAGVLSEWRKANRSVVATSAQSVRNLLRTYYDA